MGRWWMLNLVHRPDHSAPIAASACAEGMAGPFNPGRLKMNRGQMVLVACTIEAGAFSGERVFRLATAQREEYSGVVPSHYCFDSKRRPLGRDQPPRGKPINGFIEAFLVENGGATAIVELPDGEVVQVSVSQVPYRKSQDRESQYVPV
jgi:hypothetical protein